MAGQSASAAGDGPVPYAVHVQDLTIQAPIPQVTIPLAVPIVIPNRIVRLFKGKKSGDVDVQVQKELVRRASLRVEPGQVCAILGGSGSGKTTLLNAIANRLGNLEVKSGHIDFVQRTSGGAAHLKASTLSKLIGFVRQDDFLLPYLTVYETLDFAASLRLPSSTPKARKRQIIDQTINELGLTDVRDVIVGGPFRKGISGGEKRRLSIGCVLVSLPSVLILDEPTTGLDSFTAYQLLDTLSQLARNGRSVILSIHQPRSDAFGLFDKIVLVSRGDVVYSDKTSEMLAYFESQGLHPPEHTNPLDFIIDISSVDSRTDEAEAETSQRVARLVQAWRREEGGRQPDAGTIVNSRSLVLKHRGADADVEKAPSQPTPVIATTSTGNLKRPNLLSQFLLLTRRNLLNVSRNYGQSLGFLAQAIIVGVVVGLAFLNPPETPGGIQSLKTVIYQSGPAMFYLSIIVYVFVLTNELVVFDRDREDGLYSTVPAALAYFFSYLPVNVVIPTIYAVLVYFMCGFWRQDLAVNVVSFIASCIMLQLSAFTYAMLCSSLNRSFAQASLLANGFAIMFLLSAGYLIVNLPVWVSWTRWLSFYYYAFHWIGRLQLVGRQFACEGVTGPARNQCDGTNVLVGLRFPLETPVFVYPLGLMGFIVVSMMLATLILAIYHPGGVKHAVSQPSKRKDAIGAQKDELAKSVTRTKIDVKLESFKLTVSKKSRLSSKTTDTKDILEQVNAVFPCGQVSVVMGPSGSGKTSLLQSLSGRLSSKAMSRFRSSGRILFNDSEYDEKLASLVAFVEQEDAHHLPALTVRETLEYAALLRMRGFTKAQCRARADEVMRMLGLKQCADNLVGGPLLKGISGGEKRRLSLAVELISDPAVLYADEPLSGLDSFSAHNVMLSLKALAATGRTVVCSVHQPRSDIWDLFDNVLLLAKGGMTAYSGPRSEILKFFDSAGYSCPANYNAADFVLDTISVNYKTEEEAATSRQRVNRVLDIWRQRSSKKPGSSSTSSALLADGGLANERSGAFRRKSAPFARAFPIVLGRSVKNLRRQMDAFVARVSNPPFLALIFFLFYGRLTLGPSSPQDRIGLLQETTALPFVGMLACIAIFPAERSLYFHEYKSSARQSVTTFILAYTVQETLTSLFSSLLFSLIFVFGPGLQYKGRIFVEFWIAIWAVLSAGESIGIMFSAFFEDGGLAVSLVSACITLASQINGIISVTLPDWLKIIGWGSIMKPQARIQIINEMNGLQFKCTPQEVSSGACIATTGEQILETFGIPTGGTGKLMGIMISLAVIYRLLAWLAVRIRVRSL